MNCDYFLKLDGIEGESCDAEHAGEIELTSFSWGQTAGATGSEPAGKAEMQDFSFVKPACKATPRLLLACASGELIPQAVLTVRAAGGSGAEFLKLIFSYVIIASQQLEGSFESARERVSFRYGAVRCEYRPFNPDGSLAAPIVGGWDLVSNLPVTSD